MDSTELRWGSANVRYKAKEGGDGGPKISPSMLLLLQSAPLSASPLGGIVCRLGNLSLPRLCLLSTRLGVGRHGSEKNKWVKRLAGLRRTFGDVGL